MNIKLEFPLHLHFTSSPSGSTFILTLLTLLFLSNDDRHHLKHPFHNMNVNDLALLC